MIQVNGPQEEREAARRQEIRRMTNADLFDGFENAALRANREAYRFEYIELGAELERRLQRTGFLPSPELLAQLRNGR